MKQLEELARAFYADHGPNSWLDHILPVLSRAKDMLMVVHGLSLDNTTAAAVYFHDCAKLQFGAENHARNSADMAAPVLLDSGLTPEEQKVALEAIRLHDSNLEVLPSLAAEVLASADANVPDLSYVLNKSMRWALKHGLSQEEAILNAIRRNQEKYGSSGYFHWPRTFKAFYGQRLEDYVKAIDNLSPEAVMGYIQ